MIIYVSVVYREVYYYDGDCWEPINIYVGPNLEKAKEIIKIFKTQNNIHDSKIEAWEGGKKIKEASIWGRGDGFHGWSLPED